MRPWMGPSGDFTNGIAGRAGSWSLLSQRLASSENAHSRELLSVLAPVSLQANWTFLEAQTSLGTYSWCSLFSQSLDHTLLPSVADAPPVEDGWSQRKPCSFPTLAPAQPSLVIRASVTEGRPPLSVYVWCLLCSSGHPSNNS